MDSDKKIVATPGNKKYPDIAIWGITKLRITTQQNKKPSKFNYCQIPKNADSCRLLG
jgi:hypothetical protein